MNGMHAGELRLTPVLSVVVAVDQAWGIGWRGRLLFHAREDMRRFRALTSGHTVIYGRKTLETFPQAKPLTNRTNIILTRQADIAVPGAAIARSLEELYSLLVQLADPAVFVIGGASIYRQLLPFCQQAYVSRFAAELPADSFFPDLDRIPGWQLANDESWVCSAVDLVGQSRTVDMPLQFCRYTQAQAKPLAALLGKEGNHPG
jgi:dihydrofolate reductase